MKKIFTAAACVILLSSSAVSADSGGMLSPALSVISQEHTMIKSGLVSCNIIFSENDFDLNVGGDIDYITVTALPPASHGTLMYADSPVSVNQTISSTGLSKLEFIPSSGCTSSSFRFRAGQDYSIECVLKFTDSVNLAPTIEEKESYTAVWTQCDISTYGTLTGHDPDGDDITFEVIRYPENGILQITDPSSGDYVYTPCDGIMGEDSFVYVVRDEWGNYSDTREVIVDIDKAASDLVFADMDGHWAHNAAIVMASENAMEADVVSGELYFRPDEEITREDFLVTVMKALGSGEIEQCVTVFADNDEISAKASGYINRAYELGIIKGSRDNGLLCFNPKDKITRAEAAVILNAIIGAEVPETVPVFADSSSVPAWAMGSIYALTDAGVFNGTGSGKISANEYLNRAQTAQILLMVKKLYS